MILVDTSVWVDHLRSGNEGLVTLLSRDLVLTHPFVIGELACGAIRHRAMVLEHLSRLPRAASADDDEVMALVGTRRLFGRGIGWVDAHLLASALLSGARLMTLDQRLARLGGILRVSA